MIRSVTLAALGALLACGAQPEEPAAASPSPVTAQQPRPAAATAGISDQRSLPTNNGRAADTRLIFAGQPTQDELASLGAEGFAVLDLRRPTEERGFDEVAFTAARGMAYQNLPVDRPALEDPATHEAFAEAVRGAEEAERPLLVHCASGQRVAGMYWAYLVEQEGVERDVALARAEELGLSSAGVRDGVAAYLDSRD